MWGFGKVRVGEHETVVELSQLKALEIKAQQLDRLLAAAPGNTAAELLDHLAHIDRKQASNSNTVASLKGGLDSLDGQAGHLSRNIA